MCTGGSHFDAVFLLKLVLFVCVQDAFVTEQSEQKENGPLIMNAFEMITLSQGLNLSALFDRQQVIFFSVHRFGF